MFVVDPVADPIVIVVVPAVAEVPMLIVLVPPAIPALPPIVIVPTAAVEPTSAPMFIVPDVVLA